MELLGLVNYALFMAIFIGIYALLALGLNIQWGFCRSVQCRYRRLLCCWCLHVRDPVDAGS